jgi:hypothetical protein
MLNPASRLLCSFARIIKREDAHMRRAARNLAEKHGVPLQFIECRATASSRTSIGSPTLASEAIHSTIQVIKKRAFGFRSLDSFRTA